MTPLQAPFWRCTSADYPIAAQDGDETVECSNLFTQLRIIITVS
jgi:hypothetical protein